MAPINVDVQSDSCCRRCVLGSQKMKPLTLASQGGCEITLVEPETVMKWGRSVRHNESVALRLVRKRAKGVPVPYILHSWFGLTKGRPMGQIHMSFIPGVRLDRIWDDLDDKAKEVVCHDIWSLVDKIRAVPRPSYLDTCLYTTADGSPTLDPILGEGRGAAPPLHDDDTFRNCIATLYATRNGLSYAESQELAEVIPRSDKAVFTHGDIAPRNIMVDNQGRIMGLIDWESAGWYPDYWEYARMMKASEDEDWMQWMERTKPEPWDITGIQVARMGFL